MFPLRRSLVPAAPVLAAIYLAWLLALPAAAQRSLSNASAIVGQPFGVLRASLPLPETFDQTLPRILVEDPQGRVFYPAVRIEMGEVLQEQPPPPTRGIGRQGGLIDRVRSAIRGAPQKVQVPVAISVHALFVGSEPLTLQIVGDVNQQLTLEPIQDDAAALRQLTGQWWAGYIASAKEAIQGEDSPGLIHRYLVSMLADRMQLPSVDLEPEDPDQTELSQPLQTLALLGAIEPLREAILNREINYPGDLSGADQPLPAQPVWAPRQLPPPEGEVTIEPLATRVPPECFYLRFGSFANYVWFQELGERFGGDISQAVMLRGFNAETSARMERMLASKLTSVAKMFGDKLIADMAIVGTDLYMKEGASLGVLFRANNATLLRASMTSDRQTVVKQTPGARLQDLEIAGHPVSLLSTPDNRVRAFLVSDGDFVFLTTSRTLARRFIEMGAGEPSLAATPAFRWGRSWMPEANDYSVFGYFSPEFFHHLVSPQYQIELQRRLEAIAHLEIAEVASQVALAEGIAADDIEALQAAGLLSTWFDIRPDGARVIRDGEHWVDSARGNRGSFLPIADVEVQSVTRREAEEYAQLAAFYQQQWRQMDPMLVGLRRFRAEEGDGEQIAVEAYVAPFEAEKYGWIARQLAEPSPLEIRLPADDAASLQLRMRGNSGLLMSASTDYHLFVGVKDMLPPAIGETPGLFKTLSYLRAAPAYMGAWPKPGLIEQLPLGLGRVPVDQAGYSRMIGGLWRWQDQQFSLLSFDRSMIERTIPQLASQNATDPAQARLRVAALEGSQLSQWVNAYWYARGWRSSQGNARFLDEIHQQLKVPGAECLQVSQRLLDVKLQCPLGGEYEFVPVPVGTGGWWQSTAWKDASLDDGGSPLPPSSYTAPWISWFRGADVHLTQRPDSLAVVANISSQMHPLSATAQPGPAELLPVMDFNIFDLPGKIFGGAKPAKAPSERKKF